jgi:uncharacterized protein (TIGR03067 family)
MRGHRVLAVIAAAAVSGSGPALNDQDALQGTWRVTDARARMSNEPAMNIDGLVDRGTIEFAGTRVTMRQLGNTDAATFEFTLDTLASPRRLRLFDVARPDCGKWTGIYRISGDTLRVSLPIEHYSDRPTPPPSFNAPNTAAYTFRRDRSGQFIPIPGR